MGWVAAVAGAVYERPLSPPNPQPARRAAYRAVERRRRRVRLRSGADRCQAPVWRRWDGRQLLTHSLRGITHATMALGEINGTRGRSGNQGNVPDKCGVAVASSSVATSYTSARRSCAHTQADQASTHLLRTCATLPKATPQGPAHLTARDKVGAGRVDIKPEALRGVGNHPHWTV